MLHLIPIWIFPGRCVPEAWICNSVDNCFDNTDEDPDYYNCTEIQLARLSLNTNLTGRECINVLNQYTLAKKSC